MRTKSRFIPCAVALLVSTAAHAKPADYYLEAQVLAVTLDAVAINADTPKADIDLNAIAAADPALSIQKGAGDAPDSMVMLSDVLFDFGEVDLAADSLGTLESVAQKLTGVQGLQIIGHTDSVGSETGNHVIGLERAKAVKDWLIDSGHIAEGDVSIISAGETNPIAPNLTPSGLDNAEGRALNRRVEFSIIETPNRSASIPFQVSTIF